MKANLLRVALGVAAATLADVHEKIGFLPPQSL